MVVKVYVSGISGNKEVKKRQQRVLLILDSRGVKYEVIDIAEPGNEEQKDFMQNNSTSPGATISDPNPRHALPPQIFNDDQYCGDYDQFDMANEVDEMDKFLKLAPADKNDTNLITSNAEISLGNGDAAIAAVLADAEKEEEKTPIANSDNAEKEDTKDERVAEETKELTINSEEGKGTNSEADAKNEDKTVQADEQEAKNGDAAEAKNGVNEVEN